MANTLHVLSLVVVVASLATANYCGWSGKCVRCTNGGKPTGDLCTAYNPDVCGWSSTCQLISNGAGVCCSFHRGADPRGVGPVVMDPVVSAPLNLAPASLAVNPAGYNNGKRY